MIAVVAPTIAIIVAGEINHLNRPLGRGQDLPQGGGRSSSSSKIFPSSESSAARAGGGGWPTAGGAGKRRPSIDAGTSIADRLKRAAQPNSDASEEGGGFEN